MSRESSIEVEATVLAVISGTVFRVVLANKHEVLARISGTMRKHIVGLTTGDRVRIEMSPCDMTTGLITDRLQ